MGHRRGLTMRGTLGGSQSLAGGTWTGTHLFGGTLLGDVVAAAVVAPAVLFLGWWSLSLLCWSSCGASSPWTRLLTCRYCQQQWRWSMSVLQFIDKVWTSLRFCSDAVRGGAAVAVHRLSSTSLPWRSRQRKLWKFCSCSSRGW